VPEVGRFRANVFLQSQGLGAVFRVIPQRTPTLSDLLFPPVVKRLTEHQNGLVLVTGPTGSGKTTTLAAMINEINRSSQRHIVTIEDPIEFVHEPVQSVVTHREVGRHVESFAAGLRSALREAADVVVVGELRDLETVLLALQAAETGLLVLGTLHTNSAAKAVDRIIDVSRTTIETKLAESCPWCSEGSSRSTWRGERAARAASLCSRSSCTATASPT
jgi:twitching motility protein PilT